MTSFQRAAEASNRSRSTCSSSSVSGRTANVLDASAALWNEINYQRLMRYNDEDGFEGDVWDADTGALEGKYKDVLGASTAQTVRRANTEAWRWFFENKKAYHDESNT